MRILAIEPFFGGSHKAFLEGLMRESRHEFEVITLPSRHWKWTMRTAPWKLVRDIDALDGQIDLIFASDFVDLATLVGMRPKALGAIPKILYMHENQLTYPVREERERDLHFAVTNLSAMTVADAIWFNSAWHMKDFFLGAERFCDRAPDATLGQVIEDIAARSSVVHLGLDLPPLGKGSRPRGTEQVLSPSRGHPLRILWNHRWEFDKGPEDLPVIASALWAAGIEHEWVVCGQSYGEIPEGLRQLRRDHAGKIAHFGTIPSRKAYEEVLGTCDVVLSTARHEFFGISVVEAMAAGCQPLVPNRLSYPEIVGPLGIYYETLDSLVAGLVTRQPVPRETLRESAMRWAWSFSAPRFDDGFGSLLSLVKNC